MAPMQKVALTHPNPNPGFDHLGVWHGDAQTIPYLSRAPSQQ